MGTEHIADLRFFSLPWAISIARHQSSDFSFPSASFGKSLAGSLGMRIFSLINRSKVFDASFADGFSMTPP
jgi:hypothetical protein